MKLRHRLAHWLLGTVAAAPVVEAAAPPRRISGLAMVNAAYDPKADPAPTYALPRPAPGVMVPAGMAMDQCAPINQAYGWANDGLIHGPFEEGVGFLGYPYLAQLSQRSEYRTPCERLAKEMTRKWIRVTASDDKKEKVEELNKGLADFKVRELFRTIMEQDSYFGRAHIYIDLGTRGPELKSPLVISAKVKKGSVKGFRPVEAYWSYPLDYNTTRPLAADFYKPNTWVVMSDIIHRSRFLTVVSRPMPDILKPAYQFGGMALTQLAKPYVDNWLQTRQSVNDLVQAFSQMVLETDMGSALTGGDGADLFTRVDMFNKTRNNRGTMVVQKGEEALTNLSVPLTTLDMLQAQAQEHMAAVYAIPLVVLLGITPSGLNASSDGEIRTFYAWIHAQQEDVIRPPLQTVFELVQIHLWGTVDESIGFEFVELWEESKKDAADRRKVEADTDAVYIDRGVLHPEEVREKLATEQEGVYTNIDLSDAPPDPVNPADEGDPLDDPEDG